MKDAYIKQKQMRPSKVSIKYPVELVLKNKKEGEIWQ